MNYVLYQEVSIGKKLLPDVWMITDKVNTIMLTMDNIYYTIWTPCFLNSRNIIWPPCQDKINTTILLLTMDNIYYSIWTPCFLNSRYIIWPPCQDKVNTIMLTVDNIYYTIWTPCFLKCIYIYCLATLSR